MENMDRTRKFVAILIVALFVGLAIGAWLSRGPLDGAFDKTPLIEVKGELDRAQLFCSSSGCKWLWRVKVAEVEMVSGFDNDDYVTDLPDVGDYVELDVEDSRANLFVEIPPIVCHDSGVTVCDYTITRREVVVILAETMGSSGLPEYGGTPH